MRFFLLFLLLCSAPAAWAEEPLAIYDLKLFGYRLGMTYDEAADAHGFHYTSYPEENETVGVINNTYFGDNSINIQVSFQGNRLYKIIGKFDPDRFEQILAELKKSLGDGDDYSRSVSTHNNNISQHMMHKWIFPGARIDLISISTQPEFATLSMISTKKPAVTEKSP